MLDYEEQVVLENSSRLPSRFTYNRCAKACKVVDEVCNNKKTILQRAWLWKKRRSDSHHNNGG